MSDKPIYETVIGALAGIAMKGDTVHHIEFTPLCYSMARLEDRDNSKSIFSDAEFGNGTPAKYLGFDYELIHGNESIVNIVTQAEFDKRVESRKPKPPTEKEVALDLLYNLVYGWGGEGTELANIGPEQVDQYMRRVSQVAEYNGFRFRVIVESL